MRFITTIAVLFCLATLALSQDIPPGVRYKKTTDEINTLAQSMLEKTFRSSDATPKEFFGEVAVLGPILWKRLKSGSEQVLLQSKSVTLMIQGKQPLAAEAKAIRDDAERQAFWKRLRAEFANLKDGVVRKAKRDEISYYWATIPFDIEEPFLVIEVGGDRFIAHFQVKDGQPRLFWIDIVGDLEKLRP